MNNIDLYYSYYYNMYALITPKDDPHKEITSSVYCQYMHSYTPGDCPLRCDQCRRRLFLRKDARGAKGCIHCGVWCSDCLRPVIGTCSWWPYIESMRLMKPKQKALFKKKCHDESRLQPPIWRKIKTAKKCLVKPTIYIEKDSITCSYCEYDMVKSVRDIVENILDVCNVSNIVLGYMDWKEFTVVKYNWARQQVLVYCGICHKPCTIQRWWEQANGSVVRACVTCRDFVLYNNLHVENTVLYRTRIIRNVCISHRLDEHMDNYHERSIIDIVVDYAYDPSQYHINKLPITLDGLRKYIDCSK
jgi:hypothetical protein